MRNATRTYASFGAAVVGVLAAHWAAYRLTTSDAHELAHKLMESGHGWWAAAPYIAGIGAALAVAGVGRTTKVGRLRWLLAPLQAALYVGIEVGERFVNNSHHGLFDWPTLLSGSAIAAVFGLLSAFLLQTGERLVVAHRNRRKYVNQRLVALRWPATQVWVTEVLLGSLRDRGPPLTR